MTQALDTMRRVLELMDKKGVSSASVARQLGVTSANFSMWKKRGIPSDRLPRIADILSVSVDTLLGRTSDAPDGAIPVILSGRIPVVGYAKLGDQGFYDLGDPDFQGVITLPSSDPKAYALRCEGVSMLPRIRPGEFVVAEPSKEAMPGDEVVVHALDGRVMVKTLLFTREGMVYLQSVNSAQEPIILRREDLRSIDPVLAIIPKTFFNPA